MVLEHVLKHLKWRIPRDFCEMDMCQYCMWQLIGFRKFVLIENIADSYDRSIETIGIDHVGKYSIYCLSHYGPIIQ